MHQRQLSDLRRKEVDMTMTRSLGRSGRMVSALGFGCWAIGGPWQSDGQPAGASYVAAQQQFNVFSTGTTSSPAAWRRGWSRWRRSGRC